MAFRLLTFTVSRAESGLRIDDFLMDRLAGAESRTGTLMSRSKIRRLIMAGGVRVDQSTIRSAAIEVFQRARVEVKFDSERFFAEKQPDDEPFEPNQDSILYEDDWLLIVDKPPGLPTEAGFVAARDNLHAAMLRFMKIRIPGNNEPYLGLHHRLDRDTSGLVLFTKTREANPRIHELFADHKVTKIYEALCAPSPIAISKEFSVQNRLGRISPKSAQAKWGQVSDGLQARTDCELIASYRLCLYIQAKPQTGRTHQIRVHLSGLGLPILGDTLYGGPDRVGGTTVSRTMLHARFLEFIHPITAQVLRIESPLPADFRLCRDQLAR